MESSTRGKNNNRWWFLVCLCCDVVEGKCEWCLRIEAGNDKKKGGRGSTGEKEASKERSNHARKKNGKNRALLFVVCCLLFVGPSFLSSFLPLLVLTFLYSPIQAFFFSFSFFLPGCDIPFRERWQRRQLWRGTAKVAKGCEAGQSGFVHFADIITFAAPVTFGRNPDGTELQTQPVVSRHTNECPRHDIHSCI